MMVTTRLAAKRTRRHRINKSAKTTTEGKQITEVRPESHAVRDLRAACLARLLDSSNQWPEYNGYEPLDKNNHEIRLLDISLDREKKNIEVKMKHVSLNQHVPYQAVSYCWGPPDLQDAVMLDGKQVHIRKSLHRFLVVLCEQGRDLPIWLDAICIDHKNVEERSWQVSIMGEIYSQASTVLAWLGDADPATDYFMDYVDLHEAEEIRKSQRLGEIQHKAQPGCIALLENPFWTRLWIVQEMTLARAVTVMCGGRSVCLHDFIGVCDELLEISNEDRIKRATYTLDSIFQMRSRTGERGYEDSAHLLEVVSCFVHHDCENVRDKFYGLLSLGRTSRPLKPNYKLSLAEIFVDVLSDFLESSLELSIGEAKETWAVIMKNAINISDALSLSMDTICRESFDQILSTPFTACLDIDWTLYEEKRPKHLYRLHKPTRWYSDYMGDDPMNMLEHFTPESGDLFFRMDLTGGWQLFRLVFRCSEGRIQYVGVVVGSGQIRSAVPLQLIGGFLGSQTVPCSKIVATPDRQEISIAWHVRKLTLCNNFYHVARRYFSQSEKKNTFCEYPPRTGMSDHEYAMAHARVHGGDSYGGERCDCRFTSTQRQAALHVLSELANDLAMGKPCGLSEAAAGSLRT